ncbi:hypothetical protein C0Z16_28645 [Paraburkholderia rhynchosiae]|uniref:Uncharacterized protein n=1 Tax=Paraburkholderia rhynchosiae TaxID=487049 RepID=A0ABX4UZF5_9BURK|nr:hypothetical protein C0Z16_28645 [Paraburkholderia rhynchosiae]
MIDHIYIEFACNGGGACPAFQWLFSGFAQPDPFANVGIAASPAESRKLCENAPSRESARKSK